jgi:hypothetical protein
MDNEPNTNNIDRNIKPIDYEIEQFWLGLKKSMMNFYDGYYKVSNISIKRPIDKWSNELNLLQKEQKYDEIESSIIKKITLYAMDLLRYNDSYNIRILTSNIRRWDNISRKYKFYERFYNGKNTELKPCNIVFILVDIYNLLKKKNVDNAGLFDDIEIYILFKDFRYLIKFCIDNRIHSVIDKLLNYDTSIYPQILDCLNLSIQDYPNLISSKKLIKIIEDNNNNQT